MTLKETFCGKGLKGPCLFLLFGIFLITNSWTVLASGSSKLKPDDGGTPSRSRSPSPARSLTPRIQPLEWEEVEFLSRRGPYSNIVADNLLLVAQDNTAFHQWTAIDRLWSAVEEQQEQYRTVLTPLLIVVAQDQGNPYQRAALRYLDEVALSPSRQ